MNQTDQAKKIAIVAIANLFLLGAFVTFFWIRPKPPLNPQPVPVGTNEVRVGTMLFDPAHPEGFKWTVIDVDRA
jgi:hypothetical protein